MGLLLRLRAVLMKIHTSIKMGNPTFRQGLTVRSSLNFYIFYYPMGVNVTVADPVLSAELT